MIGLSPVDFWGRPDDLWTGVTLKEFYLMVRQHNKKSKNEWRRTAQLASWLLSAWSKKGKGPTAGELLGEKKRDGALVARMLQGKEASPKPKNLDEFLDNARKITS